MIWADLRAGRHLLRGGRRNAMGFLVAVAVAGHLLGPDAVRAEVVSAGSSAAGARSGVVYASQSGRATLDQGEGGGNPFASALIALLGQPSLTLEALLSQLGPITAQKSGGYQQPDLRAVSGGGEWTIRPRRPGADHQALVVTFSQYTAARIADLPGAERDRLRLVQAFQSAGFAVQTAANPSRTQLQRLLQDFALASAEADLAVVYVTGHGFERRGIVYLALPDKPFRRHQDPLGEGALEVASLGSGLRARRANLVFFGGCRTRVPESRLPASP